MRWRLARSIAITAVVAAAIGACAPAGVSSGSAEPVVYGYPYSARCPGAGIGEVVDRWGMYACNCTSYVAWALAANNRRIDWFIRGSMDAWNWPNVARRAGLRVDTVPAVDAVAVWPKIAAPFGHVALVTAVRRGSRIDVAEYNYPGLGGDSTFVFDTRSDVSQRGAVFIHVPVRRVSEEPHGARLR